MYATIQTGKRDDVQKSSETKVLQQLYVFATVAGVLTQNQTTTTDEWFGLSKSTAESLLVSSESSTLNGQTRPYLGGAVLNHVTPYGTAFIRQPACWGTKITTSINRMGDTNCYHVQRQTTVYTVAGSGDSVRLDLE